VRFSLWCECVMESILRSEPAIAREIQRWIDEGKTYRQIADLLKSRFPRVTRGLSERSLRRFCQNHSIQKRRGADLDSVVFECISTVSWHAWELELVHACLNDQWRVTAIHQVKNNLCTLTLQCRLDIPMVGK